MALRDQPYLPLYVQDFLTDEKLMECSASATGVYIRIMCVMHKSEVYGKILLKQKDKQTGDQIKNFALKLAKHLPYDLDTVLSGIIELCQEKCLVIEGDSLVQKRMVNDGELSLIRSESGQKGGKTTQTKNKKFAKAKDEANTENEINIENENVLKRGVGENNDGLCWDIEQHLLKSQKDMEAICMNTKKTVDELKSILTNYHLWNVQNEIYPKKPLPLLAGFTRWVLNDKNFNKNGSHSKLPSEAGRTIRRDKL